MQQQQYTMSYTFVQVFTITYRRTRFFFAGFKSTFLFVDFDRRCRQKFRRFCEGSSKHVDRIHIKHDPQICLAGLGSVVFSPNVEHKDAGDEQEGHHQHGNGSNLGQIDNRIEAIYPPQMYKQHTRHIQPKQMRNIHGRKQRYRKIDYTYTQNMQMNNR